MTYVKCYLGYKFICIYCEFKNIFDFKNIEKRLFIK